MRIKNPADLMTKELPFADVEGHMQRIGGALAEGRREIASRMATDEGTSETTIHTPLRNHNAREAPKSATSAPTINIMIRDHHPEEDVRAKCFELRETDGEFTMVVDHEGYVLDRNGRKYDETRRRFFIRIFQQLLKQNFIIERDGQ